MVLTRAVENSEPPMIMKAHQPLKANLNGTNACQGIDKNVAQPGNDCLGMGYFTPRSGNVVPQIRDMRDYEEMYRESITRPEQFWAKMARDLLAWSRDFDTVVSGSLSAGNVSWFLEGQLNACYNLVDRHTFKDPTRTAIIFEADEPDQSRVISYGELLDEVCKAAHILRRLGVAKGDSVAIYMPMIPEAVIAILAVIRLGAVHSAVFAGFSAPALRDRINDAESKVVITADEMKRGGKTISTKAIVDQALHQCPSVTGVLVYQRTGANVPFNPCRDLWWHEEAEKYPPYIAPEVMNSEDPLFLLYTSGSTGKPKGIMHTTAGYLLGAAMTGKYGFNIHDGDCFFCGGDIGWITGHTYLLYAPLMLGVSTVIFEGTPAYPTFHRYWNIIREHGVTHFHVAPTVLRLLKRAGDHYLKQARMPTLRVLGSVGEPIAAEVWKWYHDVVGKGQAYVCDTYFQTETGANVITPLAGVTPTKPRSSCLPFFGIEPVILDPSSGEEIHDSNVEGVLAFKQPWPSMARTVWKAHKRFMDVYLNPYKGYYFTGDRSSRDQDGYYWIRGRADDVINVSAHRLSTAEIEGALLEHIAVAEAAVVGVADEITGQAINAFVAIKDYGNTQQEDLRRELMMQVRGSIGGFATPKVIHIVPDLPKTRSGKIMRRILRKILAGEEDQLGDTTTLVDPLIIDKIVSTVHGLCGE